MSAKAADHAARDAADEGVMTKALALMDVREMDLDDGQIARDQGVEERHRGGRIPGGVDDDAVARLARLVDPVDELPLVVGLAEIDRQPELARLLDERLLDLGEGLRAVDRR